MMNKNVPDISAKLEQAFSDFNNFWQKCYLEIGIVLWKWPGQVVTLIYDAVYFVK